MSKYLTTFEDLKKNIDKKLRFNDGQKIVEGYMQNFGAGNIVLRKTRNFNDWISIGKNTPIKKIKNLELELIEEDNQEENPYTKPFGTKIDDNINHPSHYQLEINNKLVDVNTILEAISKKLDGKCDLMIWNYFSNACEYLLRSFFKGQQLSDLKKAKKEIEFMINKLTK